MTLLFLFFANSLLALSVARNPLLRDTIDWASLHCPQSANETLPTPTYGSSEAVFGVCTELIIHSSAHNVYETILDYKSYHIWNSFAYQIDLPADVAKTPEDVYVGLSMTIHTTGVLPLTNTTSTEVVATLGISGASGYLLNAWRIDDGADGAFVRAEHPNILVDLGNNVTRYLSYETYYTGLGIDAVLLLKDNLNAGFAKQGQDLKAYLEQ